MSGALVTHLVEELQQRAEAVYRILQHIDNVGPKLPESLTNRITTSFDGIKRQTEIAKNAYPETLSTFDDIVEELRRALRAYAQSVCKVPLENSNPRDGDDHKQRPRTILGKILWSMKLSVGHKKGDILRRIEVSVVRLEKLNRLDLKGFPIPSSI